jgi:hypothetical protein
MAEKLDVCSARMDKRDRYRIKMVTESKQMQPFVSSKGTSTGHQSEHGRLLYYTLSIYCYYTGDFFWNSLNCILQKMVPLTDPKAQREGRGIALLFLDLGARRGWVVSNTLRAF